jgi:hypothetical protein
VKNCVKSSSKLIDKTLESKRVSLFSSLWEERSKGLLRSAQSCKRIILRATGTIDKKFTQIKSLVKINFMINVEILIR